MTLPLPLWIGAGVELVWTGPVRICSLSGLVLVGEVGLIVVGSGGHFNRGVSCEGNSIGGCVSGGLLKDVALSIVLVTVPVTSTGCCCCLVVGLDVEVR